MHFPLLQNQDTNVSNHYKFPFPRSVTVPRNGACFGFPGEAAADGDNEERATLSPPGNLDYFS